MQPTSKPLDTPIQYLKGVGPKLATVFERRGIANVGQLLEWIPRGYEDRRRARSISTLVADERVSFLAFIQGTRMIPLGAGRRKIYEVVVSDSTGRMSLKFFRLPYRGYLERLRELNQVRVSGKVINYRGKLEIHHPEIHPTEDDGSDDQTKDILLPIYTETEGLSPQKIRKVIEQAFLTMGHSIPDPLPKWILDAYGLMPRAQALKSLHQPNPDQSNELIEMRSPAHRRLIFEEFFWLELRLALRRSEIKSETAAAMLKPATLLAAFKKNLPFTLTGAQERAFTEIEKDLESKQPMHRLVQGDVGCGKTVVAFMAAIKAVNNGFTAALMAPTEILAEQHFLNAKKILEPIGLRVVLLTGSQKGKEKDETLRQLALGDFDLVVGTHALIQEKVQIRNLALAIVDEQHRFGVDQRARLKSRAIFDEKHGLKDPSVHFLVMTATPIPRTLAMTAYGDLDFTIINELPPGRTPIVTKKVFPNKKENVYKFMAEQIGLGRQAYVIYPLIEESEKLDLKNAVDGIKDLATRFPDIRFKLLHGRMSGAEKDETMLAFKRREFDVLVSTTVVEVGVDVPNATLMIIEDANRFGLSQLHQLRGRVGRGEHKSYCVLMLGHALSEIARERAEIMEKTSDGFVIAEKDLDLRGPGEFIGTRQSGLLGFKYGHIVRDQEILKQARAAAFECLRRDPRLNTPENADIKRRVHQLIEGSVG